MPVWSPPVDWGVMPATFRTLGIALAAVAASWLVAWPVVWALAMLSGSRSHSKMFRWQRPLVRIVTAGSIVVAFMPLILHAAVWEAAAGKFGWAWLVSGGYATTAQESFRAFGAAAWVHATHGVVVTVALMRLFDFLVRPQMVSLTDFSPSTAWWIDRGRRLRGVAWAASALIVGLAVTEMTVADLFGCVTLADRFYLLFAASGTIAAALATTIPSAVLAIIITAVLWRRRWITTAQDRDTGATDGLDGVGVGAGNFAAVDTVATSVVILYVLTFVLPIFASPWIRVGLVADGSWSLAAALSRMGRVWQFVDEAIWTTVLSASAGLLATVLAGGLMSTMVYRRHRGWFVAVVIAAALVPGTVVGLMMTRFCTAMGPLGSDLYGRTILPTVVALQPRAIAVAMAILAVGYRRLPAGMVTMSSSEMSWSRRMRWVDGPLLWPTYGMAVGGAGLVAGGDLAVTLAVAPPGVDTLTTRLFGLLHSGARYQESVVTIVYQTGILLLVIGGWAIRRLRRFDPASWWLDRMVLRPTRDPLDAGDADRISIAIPSGGSIDSFIFRVTSSAMTSRQDVADQRADVSAAKHPRTLLVIKFPGTGGRGERSSPMPLGPAELTRWGYDAGVVHTWNPPGYGTSTATRSGGRATLRSIGDAAPLYTRQVIRRHPDAAAVWLVGNSLGCLAAMSAVSAMPANRDFGGGPSIGLLLRNPPPLRRVVMEVASAYPLGQLAVRRPVAALPASMDAEMLIASIDRPIALVTSGADELVRPLLQRALLERHPGRHRQVILEGLSHDGVAGDEHRGELVRLYDWLAEVVQGGPMDDHRRL